MKPLPVPLLFLVTVLAYAQDAGQEAERIRGEKIEDILRIQDMRTPFDGKLVGLLSDKDPVVRRRATLAYGSLQDSTAIGLLTHNLTDDDPDIQNVAAFALGQTGSCLGERGRKELEHDLIWNRLPITLAAGRLVEEIGKFGTGAALADLMTRVGNVPPVKDPERLMMSIARFAVRGIVSADGVNFLLRYIQPGEPAPWQALYALQRIGDRPEIRDRIEFLRLLYTHKDPLVRMNLATLLGKLRDAGGATEVLQRMADYDSDWRVRVNAFKALATVTWRGHGSVIKTFERGFFDATQHVSITALSEFPQIGVDRSDTTGEAREALHQLAAIAENSSGGFPWPLQAEAATALARIDGALPKALGSPDDGIYPKLRARLLQAAGQTSDPRARAILFDAAARKEPVIVCAALDGLQSLGHASPRDLDFQTSVTALCLRLLASHDVAVVTSCASLLGDSLFRRGESVPALLKVLADLRPPRDTEAMQEIIATLGSMHDSRALQPLVGLLESDDPAVAAAAVSALRTLTGNDYSGRTQRKAEPLYVDLDFAYLRSLPAVVSVKLETSKGDVLIDLYRDVAPFTVMNVLKLAGERGFYRGLAFHRVVANFVVQGGDPRGDGWGGPGFAIRSEFSLLSYETGSVGMANAGKDTEGSQFFITHSPQPHLDGRYTIIGRVVSGMDVIDRLQPDDHMYDIVVVK